ncbi:MAG: hypothetical protein AAFR21_05990 [Pseudomonadota bacterium]
MTTHNSRSDLSVRNARADWCAPGGGISSGVAYQKRPKTPTGL